MSAALETAACQRLDCWLTAYVDGELDAVHCLEVEDHIEHCEICCERIAMLHAAKVSVRKVAAERAPQSLRERVCRTLLDERVRGDEQAVSDEIAEIADAPISAPAPAKVSPYLAKLRYIVPLAAAATIALMVGAASLGGMTLPSGVTPPSTEATTAGVSTAAVSSPDLASASIDTLLEDLVSQHAHPPQLDVTDPDKPLEFRPILDVPVHGAAYEDDFGARYVGARRNPRAGMLQYVKRNQNRVTMYVFNTRRVDVSSSKLQSRRIGARKVYVGKVRGYPVAASERDGIGYALTADDLSAEEASSLVLAASR